MSRSRKKITDEGQTCKLDACPISQHRLILLAESIRTTERESPLLALSEDTKSRIKSLMVKAGITDLNLLDF